MTTATATAQNSTLTKAEAEFIKALQKRAIQLAAQTSSDPKFAAAIHKTVLESLAIKLKQQDLDTVHTLLFNLLPAEEVDQWYAQATLIQPPKTQLQQVTLIQPPDPSPPDPWEQSPATSMGQPQASQDEPGEVEADPFLLAEAAILFAQCGVDREAAINWAAHITSGYTPGRDITPDEEAAIQAILSNPNVEDLVETAAPRTTLDFIDAEILPLPWWKEAISGDSPLPAIMLAIGMGLFGWLIWHVSAERATQIAIRQERSRASQTNQQIIRWANCVTSGQQNCLFPQ